MYVCIYTYIYIMLYSYVRVQKEKHLMRVLTVLSCQCFAMKQTNQGQSM
jgi:hypothetical protein